MSINTNGEFIISLDFELHWGVFESLDVLENRSYFKNTCLIIPEILRIFEENNIRSSWATVGMLFLNNSQDLKDNMPKKKPEYNNNNRSSYDFLDRKLSVIDSNVNCYFAPEIISIISKLEGQELASHTYSHYYCLEEGQNIESFESDLKLFDTQIKKLKKNNYSLVFPRNQFNEDYLDICRKYNISVVRTNPNVWFWNTRKPETLIKKIVRTLDCYLPLTSSTYFISEIKKHKDNLILLPSSRFLKPINKIKLLNKLRIFRIKKEMTFAAKNKKCYHLWWHPHNFGRHPEKSINDLKIIVKHFVFLSKKYQMESSNMIDINNKYFNEE